MIRARSDLRPTPALLVDARGLDFTYPDGTRALASAEVRVAAGEVVGLLGPNGSGKSTLLRLLARPTGVGKGPRVRSVLVPDRPAFLEALSGRENLVALGRLRGRPAREAEADAVRWIERFGLATDADRAVAGYSSGMRRRLALADAFAAPVPLLLLDEPLGGLDPGGRRVLSAALDGLRAESRGALLSLHDPAFAAARCDRVVLLRRGGVVTAGEPRALVHALGAETRFEIRLAEPLSASAGSPPPGLRVAGAAEGLLSLASTDGASALPEALAWLRSEGGRVRRLEVREPDLADVYFERTGESLEPARGSSPGGTV